MGRHSDEVRGLRHSLEQRTAEVALSELDCRAKQIAELEGVLACRGIDAVCSADEITRLKGELQASIETVGRRNSELTQRQSEVDRLTAAARAAALRELDPGWYWIDCHDDEASRWSGPFPTEEAANADGYPTFDHIRLRYVRSGADERDRVANMVDEMAETALSGLLPSAVKHDRNETLLRAAAAIRALPDDDSA